MHRRAVRFGVVALLLIGGAGASLVVRDLHRQLEALPSARGQAVAERRAALEQQIWEVTGALAVAWVLGLVVLSRVPGSAALETPAAPSVLQSTARTFDLTPPPRDNAETTSPAVDLAAAADLCTDLARVTSAAALPDMLARAAAVLDASGLVLWMGAGQELFAASAYGYDPAVISRLGPIPRSAENATAAAWRTGEVRTVSGDMMSNGAVVAPLLGPENCIGVLAAEIRHGREADVTTRAVTAIVAAQLATVVAAWPGASEVNTAGPSAT